MMIIDTIRRIASRWRAGRAGRAGNGAAGDAPEIVRREGAEFRAGNAGKLAVDAEGWLDVAWPGEFPHPDGFVQVVEPADIELALTNFRNVAAAAGDAWGGQPLYIGHPEISGTAAEAPSYGWFREARVQDGRLQYRLEPTAEGNALIAGKKYKFISPYWYGTFDAAGAFHPHFVSSVGLTNNPVIRSHQGNRPLANAEGGAAAVNAAPQDAPWWGAFTGELAALIDGATDAESARRILSGKLHALYAHEETLRQLRDLIGRLFQGDKSAGMVAEIADYPAFEVTLTEAVQGLRTAAAADAGALSRLAEILAVQPGEGDAVDVEALAAAANAAQAGAAAEAELRERFAAFAVDQAIARGSVAANARASALRLAIPNLGEVIPLWFEGSAARPAAVPAAKRQPPPAVARAANAQPPSDPLAGRPLANGGAGALPVGAEAQGMVLAAAKRREGETGCGWSAANAWAWEQYHAGRLQTRQA